MKTNKEFNWNVFFSLHNSHKNLLVILPECKLKIMSLQIVFMHFYRAIMHFLLEVWTFVGLIWKIFSWDTFCYLLILNFIKRDICNEYGYRYFDWSEQKSVVGRIQVKIITRPHEFCVPTIECFCKGALEPMPGNFKNREKSFNKKS